MARPNPVYDIEIDGQGYMLERGRQGSLSKRAWQVKPRYASLVQQSPLAGRTNPQHPLVEAMEVWPDLAGGYGDDDQGLPGRYRYAENVDCRFRGQVIPGPQVTLTKVATATADVNAWAEVDGRLFFSAGRYVFEVATLDGAVTQRCDLGEDTKVVDMVAFGGQVLVSIGLGASFWVLTPGATPAQDTWTAANDNMGVTYWAVVRNTLWAATSKAAIQALSEGAEPTQSENWGATYTIGDQALAITAMRAQGDFLYIGKENGLHVVDSGWEGVAVTPELESAVDAANCQSMAQWHGRWYVPHVRGLLTYAASEYGHAIGSATPHATAGMDNPARGRVLALAGDDQCLYATIYDGAGSWLLAAREAAEGEQPYVGPLVWHTLARIKGQRCASLHLTGLFSNPRLYLGIGHDVGHVVLPRQGANPLQDPSCEYALTGSVYLPAHDMYAPATAKLWRAVAIEADELTLARYIDVDFRLDKAGPWTHVGRANVSPRHVLALPAHGQAGHTIELRLTYTIPLASKPVRIRRVTLYGAERPESLDQIAVVIRCADRLPLRGGGQCSRNAEEIRETLKALGQAARSVELVDTVGQARRVLVQAGISEEEAEQEGAQPREVLLTVYMTPFETSETRPATGTPFIVGESLVGGPDVLM